MTQPVERSGDYQGEPLLTAESTGTSLLRDPDELPEAKAPPVRTRLTVWSQQLTALLERNGVIVTRQRGSLFSMLILPAIAMIVLAVAYNALSTTTNRRSPLEFSKCRRFDVFNKPTSLPCISLGYAPKNDFTDEVMQLVSQTTGLAIGTDIRGYDSAGSMGGAIYDGILGPESVDTAVYFNMTLGSLDKWQMMYQIWQNTSAMYAYASNGLDPLLVNYGESQRLLGAQVAVDSALVEIFLRHHGEEKVMAAGFEPGNLRRAARDGKFGSRADEGNATGFHTISATAGRFRNYSPPNSVSGGPPMTLMMIGGATLVVTGVLAAALLVLSKVSSEIETGLAGSLRTIGLWDAPYWLSWFFAVIPLFILAAVIAAGVGKLSHIPVFVHADFAVHFVGVMLLGSSLVSVSLCCAATFQRSRWVTLGAFLYFAVTVITTSLWAPVGLYGNIYRPGRSPALKMVLAPMPWLHYGDFFNVVLQHITNTDSPLGGGGRPPLLSEQGGASSPSLGGDNFLRDPLLDMNHRDGPVYWDPRSLEEANRFKGTPQHHMQYTWNRNVMLSFRRSPLGGFFQDLGHWFGLDADDDLIGTFRNSSAASWSPQVHGRHRQMSTAPSPRPSQPGRLRYFHWSDLTSRPPLRPAMVDGKPVEYHPKSASFYLGMLCMTTCLYLVLAWYIGQARGGEMGAAQPFYFPVSPHYWGCMRRGGAIEEGDTIQLLQRLSEQEGSVRVHKLSKAYEKTQALKEVSLTLAPGQLFALLGQNGSGKSTFVKILSGLLEPTHGECFVFGKSVREDMSILRDRMGSCPQDDLLWAELSARQHLRLYARFKGVPSEEVDAHIMERLRAVDLSDVADSPVMKFSGGMKRRLSLALSTVGSVSILTLDEPTTGLDPLAKRSAWQIIRNLKHGRILIMTSHDLAECDNLGDSVGILANGRLRAVGSPLFLKNRFGAGYQLSIMAAPSRMAELKQLVQEHLPEAEIVGESDTSRETLMEGDATGLGIGLAGAAAVQGTTVSQLFHQESANGDGYGPGSGEILEQRAASGALTLALPRSCTQSLPHFLQVLEDYDQGQNGAAQQASKLVREWGISQSTLEEVFLRLAAETKGVNQGVPMGGSEADEPAALGTVGTSAGGGTGVRRRRRKQGPDEAVAALLTAGRRSGALENSQHYMLYKSARIAAVGIVIRRNDPGEEAQEAEDEEMAAVSRGVESAVGVVQHAAHDAGFASDPLGGDSSQGTGAAWASGPVNGAAAGASWTRSDERVQSGVEDAAGIELRAPAGAGNGAPAASAAQGSSKGRHGPGASKEEVLGKALRDGGLDDEEPLTGRQRNAEELEAVPTWQQVLGIFILRWQLQLKGRWKNCCNVCIVIIGIIFAALTGPKIHPLPDSLSECHAGYYTTNNRTCHREFFANTLENGFAMMLARTGGFTPGFGPFAGDHVAMADSLPRSLDGRVAPVFPSATWDDTETSGAHGRQLTSPWVPPNVGAAYSTLEYLQVPTDPFFDMDLQFAWDSLRMVSYSFSSGNQPRTQVWLVDSNRHGDSSMSEWDLQQGGPGVLNVSSRTEFVPIDSSIAASGGDVDAIVYGGQREIYFKSKQQSHGQCVDYWQDAYVFPNASSATQWTQEHFPDWAIQADRAVVDLDPSKAEFSYDLWTWGLFPTVDSPSISSSRSSYDFYEYTSVVFPDGQFCDENSLFRQSDYFWDNENDTIPMRTLVTALNTGFLRTLFHLKNGTYPPPSGKPQPGVWERFWNMPAIIPFPIQFPPVVFWQSSGTALGFTSLVWPLFTLFLFPSFAAAIALEKEKKLYLMMKIAGMHTRSYWLGTYVYQVTFFMLIGLVYVTAGYSTGTAAFSNASFTLFLALLLCWAHAQSGFAMFVGSAIRSSRAVSVLSYLLIVSVALATMLVGMLTDHWPPVINWIPFMGYSRAAMLIQTFGGSSIDPGSELQHTLLITLFEGTAAMLAGMYLHGLLPGPEEGSPQGPLFFLPRCIARQDQLPSNWWQLVTFQWGCCRKPRGSSSFEAELLPNEEGIDEESDLEASVAMSSESPLGGVGAESTLPLGSQNPDVLLEELRCYGPSYAPEIASQLPASFFQSVEESPLVMQGLVKDFPTRMLHKSAQASWGGWCEAVSGLPCGPSGVKRAVNGMTLHVRPGECLGLLGPNGSGKTTTMSILSGHVSATAGEGFIGGYSCATDIDKVYRTLGVCPQFDTVWDELTVKEHLEFYARLKGVPPRRVRAEVQSIAERVELDGDTFGLAASELSGGQRRRVSIGIALIGSPTVVLFDEPTTGLDVDTRRALWGLLQAERASGLSMILTSHSMEECEVLCSESRIAIMYAGVMQCIGTPLRLKNRFGEGYKLSLSLRRAGSPAWAEADEWVRTHVHEGAVRRSALGKQLTYVLPRENMVVGRAFQTLEQAKVDKSGPFEEWGIAQSSLEDVFVSVVQAAQAHEHADNSGAV